MQTVDFEESASRPGNFPPLVPFVPGISCRVFYSAGANAVSFAAQWPADIAQYSAPRDRLRSLLPESYVHLEHPRRFLPVVEGLIAILHEIDPHDERHAILAELVREAARLTAHLPENSDAMSWMQPDAMAQFWSVFDAAGTPAEMVTRLQAAFSAVEQQLSSQGWMAAQPDDRWRPFRARDRTAFSRRAGEYRFLRYSATEGSCSLTLMGGQDA